MCHYEMSHEGRGRIMIGAEWADWVRSPASVGGANTQSVHVQLPSGLDEHCERARRAGATIVAEPADQFYGDRTYSAFDLEGHRWSFADEGPRGHPGGGRGRPRPADRRHAVGVSARPGRRPVGGPRRSGPARRGRAPRPSSAPRRRARRRARHDALVDEQAPARARVESGLVAETHPDFDARVRVLRASLGVDGVAASVARHDRARLGRAADRVHDTTSSGSRDRPARACSCRCALPATPARAFAAFTDEIGQWWRPNGLFQFSNGRSGTLAFEPGARRPTRRDLSGG